jgi:copper chaperone CopZ
MSEQAFVIVQGMDCEACAVHIREALIRAGGFHDLRLDLPKQTVTITYEPAPGRLEAYVKAINDLGYEASLPTVGVR